MTSFADKLAHYDTLQVENIRLRFKVVKLESTLKKALTKKKRKSRLELLEMPNDCDRYVNAINAVYGVSEIELKSPSRAMKATQARQVLYFLLNKDLYMTTTQIGRFLDRDHSTVIYGVKVAERRFQAKIAEVREIVA